MLRSATDVKGYTVAATDGDLGAVHDLYFDDEVWVVRYIIVDTGKWLPGRLVLISPISVNQPDWVERRLNVALTREQVKNSPPVETRRPVSRQQELHYLSYYGYPGYWGAPGLWGPAAFPTALMPAQPPPPRHRQVDESDATSAEESHLRSCREITGYRLQATDGELGKIDDVLFDDLDWAIRYVVVDTNTWWFGKQVLIAPEWVDEIDWSERSLRVDVSRESVKRAPEYDAVGHVNRQWEADYYAHHKRVPYWISPERARQIKARHFRPPVITG
jgi:hypothetical protein